mgnify:CR=1 FL=1
MGKINELPILERPRERAYRYGIDTLSNIELLAILIGSGCKENSALDISYNLLNKYNGLSSLYHVPYQEFLKVKGLKKAKAIKIAAAVELGKRCQILEKESQEKSSDSEAIFQRVFPKIAHLEKEVFILIILNRNKQIIYEETMYKGIEDSVLFSIKDVLCILLVNKAKYFYLIHNHPDDILVPSNADLEITQKMIIETRKLRMTMLDHIIVGPSGYYSFLKTTRK